MNRAERRKTAREKQKLKKEVNKLTPNQLELMDTITEHKANEVLDMYSDLITKAIYKTMRENHIGKDRANKIIEESNKLLLEWVDNKKKVS